MANEDRIPAVCPDCNGSGREGEDECLLCAGFGTVAQSLRESRLRILRDRPTAPPAPEEPTT